MPPGFKHQSRGPPDAAQKLFCFYTYIFCTKFFVSSEDMTALKLALRRLNLNPHQIAFWGAKIRHAITLAEKTEQFDRHSLVIEKNLVSSELARLEFALKNTNDASSLDVLWETISPQSRILVNFEIRHFLRSNTVYENLDLKIVKNQSILLRAVKSARTWLKSKRGLSNGVKATEIVHAVSAIYQEITHIRPELGMGPINEGSVPSTFEQLLTAAMREGNIDIKPQSVRKLYSKISSNS